jgi:A/G-specific adenine glycosylase
LLGGLMEFPSTGWREAAWSAKEAIKSQPVPAEWRALPGVVEHGFTHFDIDLTLLAGEVPARTKLDGVWVRPEDFGSQALPTLMKKVARHALAALVGEGAAPVKARKTAKKKKASS